VKKLNSTTQITDKDREYPNSHLIQGLSFLGFFLIWFLDYFIVEFSIGLSSVIPLFVRLTVFLIILAIAIRLIKLAHDPLFNNQHEKNSMEYEHPNILIDSGIMLYVRHPLYLGVLLIYLSFTGLSMSIISLIIWIVIFTIYDRMASYEEKHLEIMFREAYLEYKKGVPKWISYRFSYLI
jgi:protein-S-isoprenylcysteine O-methyltransferase Ste14